MVYVLPLLSFWLFPVLEYTVAPRTFQPEAALKSIFAFDLSTSTALTLMLEVTAPRWLTPLILKVLKGCWNFTTLMVPAHFTAFLPLFPLRVIFVVPTFFGVTVKLRGHHQGSKIPA